MNNSRGKTYSVPISDAPAHVPTTLPVPSRPKQRLEPTRTSKKTQKLVVFPEAEVFEPHTDEPLQVVSDEELFQDTSGGALSGEGLRRVTAYLTTEYSRGKGLLINQL